MSQSAMPFVKKGDIGKIGTGKVGTKRITIQAKRLAKRRAGNSQFHDINVVPCG